MVTCNDDFHVHCCILWPRTGKYHIDSIPHIAQDKHSIVPKPSSVVGTGTTIVTGF